MIPPPTEGVVVSNARLGEVWARTLLVGRRDGEISPRGRTDWGGGADEVA